MAGKHQIGVDVVAEFPGLARDHPVSPVISGARAILAGDRRGGDDRGRARVDLGTGVTHAALEIAGAGGDAGLAWPEHTHVAIGSQPTDGGLADHYLARAPQVANPRLEND